MNRLLWFSTKFTNWIESVVNRPHPRCFTTKMFHHTHPPPQTTDSFLFYHQDYNSDRKKNFIMSDHQHNGILGNHQVLSLDLPPYHIDYHAEFSSIVGSCNGLVCLTDHFRDPVHICDPATRQTISLPLVDDGKCARCILSGFGFDHLSKVYKVVRMYHNFNDEDEHITEIYTLGDSRKWRNIGYVPYPQPLPFDVFGQVFVNGTLHWLLKEHGLIMGFQVGPEEFRDILPPPDLIQSLKDEEGNNMTLASLGGNLCLVNHSFDDRIDIWVMKIHGEQGSWTKEFVIPKVLDGSKKFLEPCTFMKNGNILLHVQDRPDEPDYLACYDPVAKTFSNLRIGKIPYSYWSIIPHARSLVPLEEIVGETNGFLKCTFNH